MKTRVFVSALVLTACCLFARPAHAQDADVAVGGILLFRIHATVNGMSPMDRANVVETRLQDILAAPVIRPDDVQIVAGSDKNSAKIMVKDRLLVTVCKEDGAANGVTTQKQAQMWLESLRKGLPKVNARPNPNNEPGKGKGK